MDKIWEKLWDLVSGHKWLLAIAIVIGLAIWLHGEQPDTWQDITTYSKDSAEFIRARPLTWIGVALAVVGYSTWIILVRVSNKHWFTNAVAELPDRSEYTCAGQGIAVHLVQSKDEEGGGHVQQIHVENRSEIALKKIVGRFRLTIHDVQESEIPFSVSDLKPGARHWWIALREYGSVR